MIALGKLVATALRKAAVVARVMGSRIALRENRRGRMEGNRQRKQRLPHTLSNGDAVIDENCTIEEVRTLFAGDRFATEACHCRVIEASRGHAVCAFDIEEGHLNAQGNVMGGAIFTLADFALAIGCNIGETPTVSVSNSIEFMSATKGKTLIATCSADKSGRSLGFYTVDVTDELGTPVAKMTATCFRR